MKIRYLFKSIIGLMLLMEVCSTVLAAGTKAIAVVLTTKGTAEIRKVEAKAWTALKFGVVLDDGDRLRTGEDGFVALVFTDDKSQIKIRPATEITVNAERNADYSLAKSINMQIGELFADVKKQKGSLQVATPTSVASVKGTEFWVLVGPDGETQVLTLQGAIELLSILTGQQVEVIAGALGTVEVNGTITIGTYEVTRIPQLPEELQNPPVIEINFRDANGNQKRLIIEYDIQE